MSIQKHWYLYMIELSGVLLIIDSTYINKRTKLEYNSRILRNKWCIQYVFAEFGF